METGEKMLYPSKPDRNKWNKVETGEQLSGKTYRNIIEYLLHSLSI